MDSKPRISSLLYSIFVFAFVVVTASAQVLIISNFSHETAPYLGIQHSSSAKVGFGIQVVLENYRNCTDYSSSCKQWIENASIGIGRPCSDSKMILKKPKGKKVTGNKEDARPMRMRGTIRRLLGGPGSSPPRCTAKCGRCLPCKPVHVPVPPGMPVTTEYYPEAWRCKCGNKLYMP